MDNILAYIWQLPQCLVGLALKPFYKCVVKFKYGYDYRVMVYGVRRLNGGISLGNYIFIHATKAKHISRIGLSHELGHTYQSRKWGWLYLPVVGLTSLVRAAFNLYKRGHYYDSFPEKQADEYGKVKRNAQGGRYF